MRRLWLVGFLIVVFSFVFAYSLAIPDPGHGAEKVFVFINGQNLELQSAIDSGKFGAYYTGGSYSGVVVSGHSENIFVRVNGADKSLQQAINDESLCFSTLGSGNYSGNVVFGHKGEDVLVDFGGEKSLQQAINDGLFGRDCVFSTCTDGIQNQDETDIDCGGSCDPCLIPVNCVGRWDNYYGSCSATACETMGNYDKKWIITTFAANGGTDCLYDNGEIVDNGGNVCSGPTEFQICYDGNPCHTTGGCDGGICLHTTNIDDGTMCHDGNPCHGTGWCSSGSCIGFSISC